MKRYRKIGFTILFLVLSVLLIAPLSTTLVYPLKNPNFTEQSVLNEKNFETSSIKFKLNETFKVTLVTGDVVYVANTSKGLQVVSLEPADPSKKGQGFQVLSQGEHLYVIPSYVNLKKYDLSLFDVAYLVKEKYENSTFYPVIVKALSSTVTASIVEKTGNVGAKGKVISKALNLMSIKTSNKRDSINKLFKEVLESSNVEKIWLDKKVHAKLNVSVPLIGAPSAWNLGYNGSGVKIAILDTGIDPTHPDFKFPNGTSKIILQQSFVDYNEDGIPEEDTYDHFGHGTHVASIAAGTGRASNGKFTGVAPGASLIVGKVLSNYGWGYDSWIINGIDWAVNNKANIISMSLGDGFTDGTDPVSMECDWAVDQGVVVVIAAGNEGGRWWQGVSHWTITSPGTAFKVITVGASDKNDKVAQFSSRGPTVDLRVKPDIVAPGVDIWAALAKGSWIEYWANQSWVPAIDVDGDGRYDYVQLSGTSMATPHVAGAVAIVLQKLPSLKPVDVKNLILSTSNWLQDYNVYDEGSGRLNVSYAVNPVLYLSPAQINLGAPRAKIVNTTITLVSLWSKDITLSFDVSYSSVDHPEIQPISKAFYVANQTVTLPAGGTAKIVFVANFTSLPSYDFWGIINVVNASDSKALAHGVFSAFNWYKLTVRKIDFNGNPAANNITVIFYNSTRYNTLMWTWRGFYDYTNSSGMMELYLPEGFYNIVTSRYDSSTGKTYWIVKQVRLTSDTTVNLDERETNEVKLQSSGLTPTEKSIAICVPFYRLYPDSTGFEMIMWSWLTYYPSSLSDYALTPYPVVTNYMLVPSDKVNPSYPDLIESDVLYEPTAFFENIASPQVISPNYNMSVNVEYRTYATPIASARTWHYSWMNERYNGSWYSLGTSTLTYKLNIPKSLTVKKNPFWLGTSSDWAELGVSVEKDRDLPGVSTPYWAYNGHLPLKYLYEAGKYESKLYLVAEPEHYRNGAAFILDNGSLIGVEFWSTQTGSFNYTYCWGMEATYYDIKAFVNGTDITGSLSKYWGGAHIEAWTRSINFSLPAKVEILHNFTRRHTLSSSISVKNTFVVENWGNSWYYHVPLQLDYDKGIEIVGLDNNNTLTAVRPIIVKIFTDSYYNLTHAVLKYNYKGTWYNSSLLSGGFGAGSNTFTFTLDSMGNNTFVDLSIYLKDVKGNELEENITKAFYVKEVKSPTIFTLADLPKPFVVNGVTNVMLTPGSSDRRGPLDPAHTIDVAAAQYVAFALGTFSTSGMPNVYMDWEVANYNSTHVFNIYRPGNIITFGFPTVNTISWYYNYYKLTPAGISVLPVYFGVDSGGAFIHSKFSGGTYRMINDYFKGVPVIDYAVIELYHDVESDRYILIVAGLSGFSTRESAKYLATSLLQHTTLNGKAVILELYDKEGDAVIDDIRVVETIP